MKNKYKSAFINFSIVTAYPTYFFIKSVIKKDIFGVITGIFIVLLLILAVVMILEDK